MHSESRARISDFRFAVVDILVANDVVLIEITARLNLDKQRWNLPRVFEPVSGTDRNVGRLVLGEQKLLFTDCYPGCSRHDDPMLGAMVMTLERELLARLHHQAFHLKTIASLQTFEPAPGPVNAPMKDNRIAVMTLALLDNLPDLFRVLL